MRQEAIATTPTAYAGDFDAALSALKAAELSARRNQIEALAAKAKALVVNSIDSEAAATEIAVAVKDTADAVEKQRKDIVGPFRRFIKDVDSLFSPIAETAEAAVKTLRKKVGDWRQAEADRLARLEAERQRQFEEQKRKAEEEARRINEEARRKAEKEAKKHHTEPVYQPAVEPLVLPLAPAKQPENVTRSKSGAATYSKQVWTYRVANLAAVPMEWWMLNDAMIQSAIGAGLREIPGLEIYPKQEVAFRR